MTKRKKTIFLTTVALVAILGIGTFAYSNNKSIKEKEYLSASWEYNYRDVEEISQDSDLIAMVNIKGVGDTVVENSIPYTTFSAEVVTPIYNTEIGENISIYMTGGETEEKITEIVDDPLLQINDDILIFCKQNPDGTYRIISGPQGRLVYSNGKLSSLNAVNARVSEANSASNIKIQNADADTLISEIKGYVGAE